MHSDGGLDRQMGIKMRKQRAVARRLPLPWARASFGHDDQQKIRLAGAVPPGAVGYLLGGREMHEAIATVVGRPAIDAPSLDVAFSLLPIGAASHVIEECAHNRSIS